MASNQPYVPVDGHDASRDHDSDVGLHLSPDPTPRLAEADLGRMSFFENVDAADRAHNASASAGSSSYAHLFSSAQAYQPVAGAQQAQPPTPGTPGTFASGKTLDDAMRSTSPRPPWLSQRYSDRGSSYRYSVASSNMLAHSDVGSENHLNRYQDSGIPLHSYEGAGTMEDGQQEKLAGGKSSRYRTPMSNRKKWWLFAALVAVLVLIAIAVAVPLVRKYDGDHEHDLETENDGQGPASVPGTGKEGTVLTSGGDGSVIRMENGTTFTYTNSFGGQWRSGLTDNGAQAQNYTPAMNETWDYGRSAMMGVNLGGWLVIEPFIVPALFEPYENVSGSFVVDEYTLMLQWESEGGQSLKEQRLRNHYDTFITEYDFMMIAAAGLNWIRLPIGYWAVSTMPGEPFVAGLSWEYFLKAVQWARKYGLRINLDLHAVQGNANGYNHGGRWGVFNFLNSPAGLVSSQRALDVIRVLAEFISQPEIANVVPMFGILNEPNLPSGIGMTNMRNFYVEAYKIIRSVGGTGAGNGPIVSLHDGFMTLPSWSGFLQNADRVSWDLHPYDCFVPPFRDRQTLVATACNSFAANEEMGLNQFGLTIAGEWSLAPNDCGLYLNGPYQGVRYDGSFSSNTFSRQGDCEPFDDWASYSNNTKRQMYQGAIAQMASFRNFFFWTWKIGNSLRTGGPVNPNWSYLLGYQQGWMPKDPRRETRNACASLQSQVPGITKTALNWASSFSDWQTGAASTYTPSTAAYTWPPPSMMSSGTVNNLAASTLPAYTSTGPVMIPPTPTLSVSFTNEATPSINPWVQGGRQTPAFAPIAGCSYFDSVWTNVTSAPSGWPCQGSGSRRRSAWGSGSQVNLDYDNVFDVYAAPREFPRRAPAPPQMTAAPVL